MAVTKSLSKIGSDFRSLEVITDESRFSSLEVRSLLASALTTTLEEAAAMESATWTGAARAWAVGVDAEAAPGTATVTWLRDVLKPASETTRV